MMQNNLLRSIMSPCCVMVVSVMFILKGTFGVCPRNPDTSVLYVPVPVSNYDRTYSSITSEGKQPLGFSKAVWHYNQNDAPCIKVTNTTSRRLEIMAETIPAARLCVRTQQSEVLECSDTASGQLYTCWKSAIDPVYLEFFCDGQCGENDVQFWYRIVLGDTYDEDPEDHWCESRKNDEYPQSLLQLDPDYPLNQQTTTPGDARRNSATSYLCLLVVFFIAGRFV